jgi:hypothetical protein
MSEYIHYLKFKENITSFTDEYAFLDWEYPCEFMYQGSKWYSVFECYHALAANSPKMTKKEKLELMGGILVRRFTDQDHKELLSTRNKWLCHTDNRHSPFWHNCNCFECMFDNENNYGLLLMEIRDWFILQDSHYKHKHKWKPKYFK